MKSNQVMKKMPLMMVIGCLLLSACSDDNTSGIGKAGKHGDGKKFRDKPVPVEEAKPEVGMAFSEYVTTSTLSPSSDAKINARTSGVVRELLHEEGDDVKKGTVLLIIENEDQELRLKQAKIKHSTAKREYERLNAMRKKGAVSANDWEASYNTFQTSKTDLELAKLAVSYTKIVAPFDGRVVWREVDLGGYVSNGALLFRMMSIKPLLLRVYVPANRIEKVAIGQPVSLSIDSINKIIEGTVSLVSPIVDPATGTVKVTVSLSDYPEGVRPGDFTEIRMITNQRENALMVPSTAIIEERGQHYLYLDNAGKATKKFVEIGYVLNDKTEIISGLSANDRVVIKGHRSLNEGSALKIMTTAQ